MDPDARSGRAAGRRLAEGLQKACRRLAEGLQKLGMKSEDRVTLLSLHSDRLIEYFFAVVWAAER